MCLAQGPQRSDAANLLAIGKIQGLFQAFECFSSSFQGKFYFQDSPVYSSTFQACANPVKDYYEIGMSMLILKGTTGCYMF